MKPRIVRHSKDELKNMKRKTNHQYVQNTSDNEISRQVESDPDSYIPAEEELKNFKPARKESTDD